MWALHRVLLGVLLLGNTLAFAGVDPITRTVTAGLVLVLVLDLPRLPAVPRAQVWAGWGAAMVVVVQLLPLPSVLRGLLQPGYAQFLREGWAPLSLAPWATVQVAASLTVMAGVAVVAARMAGARTGLPTLLALLAGTGALLAVLGLAGEAGAPASVLLVRANTGGGDCYGPFVNSNHFALAVELTVPAAVVLLAVSLRQLREREAARHRPLVVGLASGVACAVGCAAMLRSGSRGGLLFLGLATVVSLPLWRRPSARGRWRWIPVAAVVVAVAVGLASTRLAAVREGFSQLLVLEGVEGNSRWDLWGATVAAWSRAPVLGSGLGSYRYVIGIDKPATGDTVLEQAHNDWLEWLATGGIAGVVVLGLALAGVGGLLLPGRVHRLRYELRYPLAGAGMALIAAALHEAVGFGLQTPLNRYLMAAWVGLVWGLALDRGSQRQGEAGP